jgi:hypothetical protein
MVLEVVSNKVLAAGLHRRTQSVATLCCLDITARVYTFLYPGFSPMCKGACTLQRMRLLSVEHCTCRAFCYNA